MAKLPKLTDLSISADQVSLRVDGKPMQAVRVQMGVNYLWRIKFSDDRLSEQAFANADRAVRWIAAGMPVEAGDERVTNSDERLFTHTRPGRPKAKKGNGIAGTPEEPDPEWLPLHWVPLRRSMPVAPEDINWLPLDWQPKAEKLPATLLAAVPGAPALVDAAAIARPAAEPAGAASGPATAPSAPRGAAHAVGNGGSAEDPAAAAPGETVRGGRPA